MSIVITVKVGEGVVLVADSAGTIEGEVKGPGVQGRGILQTYYHAKKISHLGDYPIGTLTWGISHLGARNIESFIKEYESTLPPAKETDEYKVEDIAKGLCDFISSKYNQAFQSIKEKDQRPVLGFIICGYSSGKFLPEQYRRIFPVEEKIVPLRPDLPNGRPKFGANWYGVTDAVARLFLGFDPRLEDEFVKAGLEREQVRSTLRKFEYPVIFDGMPLQDAIDLAVFLASAAIWRSRFHVGAPTVGGDIDVAVITHRGFEWVKRKKWKAEIPLISIGREGK